MKEVRYELNRANEWAEAGSRLAESWREKNKNLRVFQCHVDFTKAPFEASIGYKAFIRANEEDRNKTLNLVPVDWSGDFVWWCSKVLGYSNSHISKVVRNQGQMTEPSTLLSDSLHPFGPGNMKLEDK